MSLPLFFRRVAPYNLSVLSLDKTVALGAKPLKVLHYHPAEIEGPKPRFTGKRFTGCHHGKVQPRFDDFNRKKTAEV